MPNYDYICTACSHELEVFQSMKDAPLKKCPKCRKMKLSRKIGGGAGLIFKGSGFYETDYKRKGSGESRSDSSSDAGSSSSSKEASTDRTKPDSSKKEPATKE